MLIKRYSKETLKAAWIKRGEKFYFKQMRKCLKRPACKTTKAQFEQLLRAQKTGRSDQNISKTRELWGADKGVGQLGGVLKFEFLSCLHYFKYIACKTRIFTAQIKFWLRESDNKA